MEKTAPVQRAAPRRKVFQPATMQGPGGTARVHLLDLSCGGALVHADSPPEPGTTVHLACDAPLGAARVVWQRGKRFGIMFLLPLTEEAVAALLADHQAVRARPGAMIR